MVIPFCWRNTGNGVGLLTISHKGDPCKLVHLHMKGILTGQPGHINKPLQAIHVHMNGKLTSQQTLHEEDPLKPASYT